MQSTGPQNPYEVYCYACNVTAPLGNRNCVHCGGRLSGPRIQPSTAMSAPFEGLEDEETLGAGALRIGGISPMTVIWILLLIGGSFYRLCR